MSRTTLVNLIGLSFSFLQLRYHDVVTEVEGKVPLPRLPHLRH